MDPSAHASSAWANLLYVNNLLSIRDQYMGWCWSLAIEEQFYLIAPILLLIMMRFSRYPLRWMLVLLAISGFLRFAIIRTYDFTFPFTGAPDTDEWALRFDVIYDKLHVRYGGLLAGVMGAYLSLYHSQKIARWIGTPVRANSILIAAMLPMWWISNTSRGSDWYATIPKFVSQLINSHQRDIFSIGILLVILLAIHGQGLLSAVFRRLLSSRLLYPVSQLSYSMYLLHEMYMLWLFPKTAPWLSANLEIGADGVILVNGLLVSVMTVVSAGLLYLWIERPCMDFRQSKLFVGRVAATDTTTPAVQSSISTQ
ncbi:MAG: acyltransferase family protein [Pirellulaceae bacterium]